MQCFTKKQLEENIIWRENYLKELKIKTTPYPYVKEVEDVLMELKKGLKDIKKTKSEKVCLDVFLEVP